ALRIDALERMVVLDLRPHLALSAGEREPVLEPLADAREPLAQAHLDALPFPRLDGKDVEGEAALAGVLQQARVAAFADHALVQAARGVLLEDLADDLLLAVPVGEALDDGRGGAQHVAAFELLVGEVLELLLEDGLRVLVVDADPDALGDGFEV